MAQPKALVFDLLTALLDSWSIWSFSVPDSEKHIASGETWRKRYLDLTYGCGKYVEYEDLVQQAARDVGLGEAAPKALVENWDSIKSWPEVPDVLRKLRKQGYMLGVVTNCSNELGLRAVRNLEAAVADGFEFDAVVTAEESGFYKPNAKPYRNVLAKLDVSAVDAVFVAGSAADIPGASGVGMKVVWNNHIGLQRKNDVKAWREGATLNEALGDLLETS